MKHLNKQKQIETRTACNKTTVEQGKWTSYVNEHVKSEHNSYLHILSERKASVIEEISRQNFAFWTI